MSVKSQHMIVFLRYLPLTLKVVEDFYMHEMVSWGYEVEYWDISGLFFTRLEGVEAYSPAESDRIRIISIGSREELSRRLRENRQALFVSIMSFERKLIWLFRLFKKYGCKTAVFSYYPLPLHVGSEPLTHIVFDIKKVFSSIYNRLVIHFSFLTGYISAYTFVFKGGEYGWKGMGYIPLRYLKDTVFFEVNNWDYDRFLTACPQIRKEPFIVFLDEYYPFHPDALYFGKTTVEPSRYFQDLDRVFSAIEEYYGMPVVIAAHPKALKYRETNYFNGREVFFNATLDLVSRASLVLAHDSLSIGYAIMCKKQLVFIDSEEIKLKLPESSSMTRAFAGFFHSPLLLADHPVTDNLQGVYTLPDDVRRVYEELVSGYMTTLKDPQPNIVLLQSYLKTVFQSAL